MNGSQAGRLSKVVFLGTGTSQGVPVIGCSCEVCLSEDPRNKRLRSSVMFESSTGRAVIDTGPDFRTQMLRERVSRLDAVVYTHEHKDHLAGMDDIRPFNYLQKCAMNIHASPQVEEALRRDFHYAFAPDRHGGVPDIEVIPIVDGQVFRAATLDWMPLPVMHGMLPIHGFRVDNVAYITDASDIPESTMERLQGLEILVLNALRRADHCSHFSLDQAVQAAREIGAVKTVFTHVSHLMGPLTEAEKELPENMHFAFDGLTLSRSESGVWKEGTSAWVQRQDWP